MRPVLVGTDNPHSDDPADALHPSKFPGSAGSRLFQMVREVSSVSEEEYLRCLDRTNYKSPGPRSWARQHAKDWWEGHKDRDVVLLGSLVASSLFTRTRIWYEWKHHPVFTKTRYVVVPHPSGLSRVYNDPVMRRQTGELVAKLIRTKS